MSQYAESSQYFKDRIPRLFIPFDTERCSARVRVCVVPRSVHHAATIKLRAFVPVIYSGYRTVYTPSPHMVSESRERSRRFTFQIPIAI
ncbi:hypothetical protein EVAR_86434_1 [Eumeta japonica]|uniref:Uncharacterized protein n=1 Tax=Eumeta variegata TaxID=151549 RepID=A0A4C1Z974_EUMVA|nr:hypothetical protein EVAR_86434_1 [Eumeta japonica]